MKTIKTSKTHVALVLGELEGSSKEPHTLQGTAGKDEQQNLCPSLDKEV